MKPKHIMKWTVYRDKDGKPAIWRLAPRVRRYTTFGVVIKEDIYFGYFVRTGKGTGLGSSADGLKRTLKAAKEAVVDIMDDQSRLDAAEGKR